MSSNKIIKVEVEPVRYRDGWSLIIHCCPLCGKRHMQGGGTGEQPYFGTRAVHCLNSSVDSYELIPEGSNYVDK